MKFEPNARRLGYWTIALVFISASAAWLVYACNAVTTLTITYRLGTQFNGSH